MFGLIYLNKRSIEGVYRSVGGTALGIGNTAIQGAAFGFGAGKAGGIGGTSAPSSGGAPTPTPRPPTMRPISATPVTSVLPEAYAPVSAGGTYTVTAKAPNPSKYRRPTESLIETAKRRKGTPGAKKAKKGSQTSIVTPAFRQRPYGGQ